MKENVIQQKSFDFSVRTINLYKYLIQDKKEYVLSKQLLRSGTSIGANVEEVLVDKVKKILLQSYQYPTRNQEKLVIGYGC